MATSDSFIEKPTGSVIEQERSSDMLDAENGKVDSTPVAMLSHNIEARIRNPLKGIPQDILMRQVEGLAARKNLVDIVPVLKQGALLAQDPTVFDNSDELDDTTREELRSEVLHKWHQPWALYMTIVFCSIGAAVQGWDQTGSNGANLSFPVALGIDDTQGKPNAERNSWIIGVINAAPYRGASLCGCWCSSPLNYLYGRRGTIFVAAIFCLFSVLGSAFCQTWPQLLICRLLLGLGMGAKASTIPIFAAENSPASIRGGLVMTWQMWTAFGILMGTVFNLALYQVGTIAWRLQLGSAFIPAVPLALGIFLCPESPRWYMKKDHYKDAYKSLCRLRNTELQAARDLYYIHAQLAVEAEVISPGNYLKKFTELVTVPRVRRATLASFTVMIAQQMCGINIIAFYSSTVFAAAGSSVQSALLASLGFGLVSFFFTFPAFRSIDSFGRRSLLLFTFPQMAWSLLAAGFSNYIPGTGSVHVGIVAFFVYLFSAFYACGEGPVPYAYSAEVFPLSHREIGMSWATSTNFFWAAVLSITFPRMLNPMGIVGAFGFYASLNVIAFCLIFCFMPETKQRTLEELNYVCNLQPGEIGAATCAIRLDVDEEGRFDVAIDVGPVGEPVVVVPVLVGDAVALDHERLDETFLGVIVGESAGALLDAADYLVAGQGGGLRGAVVGVDVDDFSVVGPENGGFELASVSQASAVVKLRQEDFEAHLQEREQPVFVNSNWAFAVCVPWYEPCQKLSPELDVAADSLEKKGISIIDIDCSEEDGQLCTNFNITSYPAMRICRGPDNCVRYREQRTARYIRSYLIRETLPEVSEVTESNLEELTDLDVTAFIAYIHEDDVASRDIFTSVATSHQGGSVIFGITSDIKLLAPVIKDEGVKSPYIVLYNPLDHIPAILSKHAFTNHNIAKFLEQTPSSPLIGKFSLETYYHYTEIGLPLTHIFATTPTERQRLAETLQPIAERYRGTLNFATIDAVQYSFFAPTLGVDPERYPAVVIEDLQTGETTVFDQSKEISTAEVWRFVLGYVRRRQNGPYETGIRDEL
ncbi:hypothetical protein B7463_g6503, partial [Scytalidium lignicola]